ncbi:unnamed protein product, partial [Closterium sp. NIES-53]
MPPFSLHPFNSIQPFPSPPPLRLSSSPLLLQLMHSVPPLVAFPEYPVLPLPLSLSVRICSLGSSLLACSCVCFLLLLACSRAHMRACALHAIHPYNPCPRREWAMLRLELFLDSTVKVLGPLYVLIALVLILAIVYLAFSLLLPMAWPIHTPAGMLHAVAAAWVSFNILFNFYCAATRHPGSPPPLALPDKEIRGAPQGDVRVSVGRIVADMQLNLSDTMPCVRWCDKCQNLKPPLTHHCHICERCVLKMDHHCPWMHNCIGLRNYRYFFLF